MGSTATFALGGIGGFNGRALRAGDTVRMCSGSAEAAASLPVDQCPDYGARANRPRDHGVRTPPRTSLPKTISKPSLAAQWKVHYNSSRTGVRLTGPQPAWARPDGGEAGLHPSNIHDNAYAFGSIDFTGDMPVILGPDGPSLGRFRVSRRRWSTPIAGSWVNSRLATRSVSSRSPIRDAARLEKELDACIDKPRPLPRHASAIAAQAGSRDPSVPAAGHRGRTADFVIRRAGQEWLLIEFGPHVLDIALHLKAHALRGAA